jgi:outer membrane receptor protein involved in Fe transport
MYTVLAGVRVENTSISGNPLNTTQTNLSPFTQNYTTFVPSLTIQKVLTPSQTLKLTYSKRISRPSLTYLNPFLNQTNPQSQSEGNPSLGPEISQSIELNYNVFVGTAILNASTFYKHTTGLIESIATPTTYLDNSGNPQPATLTKFLNIGNNNSFGASFFGSVNPIPIMTIRGQISSYTYKPDPSGQYLADQSQNSTYIQYNAFGSASITTKSGFITELFVVENSPRRTIQGTNPSFSLFGVGVRQQIFKKKASIGINTLSPFEKYKDFNSHISSPGFTQTSTTQFPFRSIGFTFSYNFGKLSFSTPKDKNAIKNDDLKQGDQGMGGGAPDPAGGKPPR